jgi:hypothetical protein
MKKQDISKVFASGLLPSPVKSSSRKLALGGRGADSDIPIIHVFRGVAEVCFNPILVGAASVHSDSTFTVLILVA